MTGSRRPWLKRISLWTSAVAVLLVWYFASLPFVRFGLYPRVPTRAKVVVGPVVRYWSMPATFYLTNDFPGSEAYLEYLVWWQSKLFPKS